MRAAPSEYVYLDYAATAPLRACAVDAMAPFLVPGPAGLALGANANSLHGPGRAAFAALEDARGSLARDLRTAPFRDRVHVGGDQADNMAVLGIARAAADERRRRGLARSLRA
ncbi:MAG: hypothetical protein ACLSVD_15115 [Eggerthellaceae bacterium]